MTIANVTLNNTFDEWRSVTNQLINFVNEVDSGNLTKFYSNSAVLTVTENVARNGKNFITLNVSSDVLDTSTLNVATANAINIVFSSVSNSEARITLLYNNANVINSIANAAIIQANTARVHANAAFATVNSAFGVANTALPNTSGTVYNGQLTIPVLIAGSPATDTARLRFGEAGNISYIQSGTQVAGSGRPIHFTTYSTATATMVVDAANGNVLIGRTDSTIGQSVRLDVNGGINAASFLTGTGQAVLNNSTTLISTGYTVTTFNAGSNIAVHLTWQPNAANGNYQVVAANEIGRAHV